MIFLPVNFDVGADSVTWMGGRLVLFRYYTRFSISNVRGIFAIFCQLCQGSATILKHQSV
ncbi:hypothetical protein CQ062_06905 [Ochrobactrum sp. MYb68]|nr:hypothetical protein CQ062_06905 [Ochrobactrum sp. MYb68]